MLDREDLAEDDIPFAVGDLVLFGKYKNKKGRVVGFGVNHKGQATVEIEPVPKGRKKNRVLGLFKVWTTPSPDLELESVQKLRVYGPPNEWSGSIAGMLGPEGRKELQKTWRGLSKAARAKVKQAWDDSMKNEAAKRVKRRKAGTGQRKVSKQCPPGLRMKDGRCQRVSGADKTKQKRQRKKWGRSGAAKRSRKKSARLRKRFDSIETLGALIQEAREALDNP